jgi:hypothetical protein
VEQFCFSRNKEEQEEMEHGEIWVQLLEKAWAKVCGSHEQAEAGTCAEALDNIDGTPSINYSIKEIEKLNQHAKLWDILQEAD